MQAKVLSRRAPKAVANMSIAGVRRPRHPKIRRIGMAVLATLLALGSFALVAVAPAKPAAAFGTPQPMPIPSVSAGGYMSCGVQADFTAACWGENGVPSNDIANVHPGGSSTPPAGVQFDEVTSGYAAACGVKKLDKSIVCWGSGRFEKVQSVPPGQYKHVAAAQNYVCALRTDDTIKCWGGDDPTIDPDLKVIRDQPAGTFSQVTVGSRHACALRNDGSGTIVCWGHNTIRLGVNEAQTTVPPGSYKWVDTGNFTPCAIKTDDTPVCWGRNINAQRTYPTNGDGTLVKFSDVSSGSGHVCGRRLDDQTVVCWGSNAQGQVSPVPSGAFTQVSAGTFHSCGMRVGESRALCWGNNMSGRVQPNMNSAQPPRAYVDVDYSANLTMNPSPISGAGDKVGISPAPAFSLVEGALPPGLTLLPSGQVFGTPEASGLYTIKVAASNGLSPGDCWKASSTGDSMFCTPGDPNSLGTATRVFTYNVADEVPAPGTVTGRLTSSADGSPIAGATVKIAFNDTTPAGEATTDGNGSYTFAGVAPDSYKVTASGIGFTPQTKAATVNTNETTTVDFALVPRLARPTVLGVANNHWETVTDGVFVEWSEEFDVLQQVGFGYKVHGPDDSTCTGTAIATGTTSNWLGENPNSTPPRTPSRIRDIEMNGYGNVTPGATHYLRVDANVEFGKTTGQQNNLTCFPYVAKLRPSDSGKVIGKVTSAGTGAPIAGAVVTVNRTIREPGTVAGQATTDAAGNYTVSDLAPSTYLIGNVNSPYQVVVSSPGYTPKTGSASPTFAPGTSTVGPSTSTVTLNVALVNNAPDAVDDAYSTNEDTPLTVSTGGVLSNDTDAEGDTLTAAVATGPANGTLALSSDGTFTYTPNAEFNGADSFTYTASDSLGASDTATVAIDVGTVNDAPVANDDSYATGEDTALTVSPVDGVLANDTDVDGDALSAAVVTGPSNGSLTLNADGSFTYTPNANFNGADSFTYTASDGLGGSDTATVSITVNAVNDAPAAANDAYSHSGSDTALVVVAPGVLGNDSDPVEGSPLTASLRSGPSKGTLTLNADGSFTYKANEDFVGTDSFTYVANDGSADSNVATVTITVGAGCRGQAATIVGTSGNDRLTGTSGADVIVGLGGNDTINGAGGNDVICGGSGTDVINTGGGDDYANGGSGNDKVKGDVGNDTLIGGAGADEVAGGDGNDLLSGGADAIDSCQGDLGTDALAPNHGCEKITGIP